MQNGIILCVDIQRDYDGSTATPYDQICQNINRFADQMRLNDIELWRIYYDFSKNLSNKSTINFNINQKTYTSNGITDPLKRSFFDINPQENTPTIFKNGSSSFNNKNLLPLLRAQNIHKIWIVGYHAEDCVAATALDGTRHGFDVVVVSDLSFVQKGAPHRTPNQHASTIKSAIDYKYEMSITPKDFWDLEFEIYRLSRAEDRNKITLEMHRKYLCVRKMLKMRRDDQAEKARAMRLDPMSPYHDLIKRISIRSSDQILSSFPRRPINLSYPRLPMPSPTSLQAASL
jgi:nicotinamidase-related amidase